MVNSGSLTINALEDRDGNAGSLNLVTSQKLSQVISDLMSNLHPYQRTVLGLLAIAHMQRASLHTHSGFAVGDAMRSLAVEIPGKDAYRLIALADSLDQGKDPLVELEQFPQLIPPQTLVILRLAESEGCLRDLYSQIITRSSGPGQPLELPQTRSKFGAYAELFFVFALVCFFLLRILPEFKKLFDEFQIEFSPLNQFLLNRILNPATNVVVIVVGVLFLVLVLFSLIWLFRKGRLLMSGLGVVGWQHPKRIPSIERLKFLAMIADLRQPLATALEFFGTSKAMSSFFPKKSKLKQQISQGIEPWTALSSTGVVTSADAKQISQASPDAQAWLLRRIASKQVRFREIRSVFWQRGQWFLFRCFLILVTLTMSVFLFRMLVDMINGLIQNER